MLPQKYPLLSTAFPTLCTCHFCFYCAINRLPLLKGALRGLAASEGILFNQAKRRKSNGNRRMRRLYCRLSDDVDGQGSKREETQPMSSSISERSQAKKEANQSIKQKSVIVHRKNRSRPVNRLLRDHPFHIIITMRVRTTCNYREG